MKVNISSFYEKMVQNDTKAMWQAIKWQIKLSKRGAIL